ncbi:MAG: hypothetical protein GXO42_00035 [bacterium]|nr:hypothetical protein [bacterium]
MNDINLVAQILNEVLKDRHTPRNIKQAVSNALKVLEDNSKELPVRASIAISEIERIIDDPNMPYYIRTLLFQAVSKLEEISRSA